MKHYDLYLDDDDYRQFRRCPKTRLYDHRREPDGTVKIWTNKPLELARNLEAAIDFGATSALEVLGLPPITHF